MMGGCLNHCLHRNLASYERYTLLPSCKPCSCSYQSIWQRSDKKELHLLLLQNETNKIFCLFLFSLLCFWYFIWYFAIFIGLMFVWFSECFPPFFWFFCIFFGRFQELFFLCFCGVGRSCSSLFLWFLFYALPTPKAIQIANIWMCQQQLLSIVESPYMEWTCYAERCSVVWQWWLPMTTAMMVANDNNGHAGFALWWDDVASTLSTYCDQQAMQCNAMQCNAMQCNERQCSTSTLRSYMLHVVDSVPPQAATHIKT